MDKILESFLEDFRNDFGFGEIDKSKLFEHFINYCLISKIEKDRSIIEMINVGGDNNPGIDGLAIIVNDHLVTSEEEVDYFYDILNCIFHGIPATDSIRFRPLIPRHSGR